MEGSLDYRAARSRVDVRDACFLFFFFVSFFLTSNAEVLERRSANDICTYIHTSYPIIVSTHVRRTARTALPKTQGAATQTTKKKKNINNIKKKKRNKRDRGPVRLSKYEIRCVFNDLKRLTCVIVIFVI